MPWEDLLQRFPWTSGFLKFSNKLPESLHPWITLVVCAGRSHPARSPRCWAGQWGSQSSTAFPGGDLQLREGWLLLSGERTAFRLLLKIIQSINPPKHSILHKLNSQELVRCPLTEFLNSTLDNLAAVTEMLPNTCIQIDSLLQCSDLHIEDPREKREQKYNYDQYYRAIL